MDRRTLLRGTGALAVSLALPSPRFGGSALLAAGCEQLPAPGVQLFTVREALGRDPGAALARLGAFGLEEVELFGLGASGELFGLAPAALRERLDASGLRAPLTHVGGDVTASAAIADAAHTLGVRGLVMALAPDFTATRDGRWMMVGAENLAQLDRLADRLNALGTAFRAHGLQFGYHNHHVEFFEAEGRIGFDYLMARTDPELVKIELDIAWVAVAGYDPIAYLNRYAGRVIACHLKDLQNGTPLPDSGDTGALQSRLVEPGAGTIDFAAVLETMRATGVAHGFIEIDVSADPFGAIERGHRHLQALRCAFDSHPGEN
jgi:sugar phosphate isomerase/epimerase